MRKDNWNMALRRNVILNDTYQVRQVLTCSELAIVYVGRNRHTGTKVAIKEFFLSESSHVRRINAGCTVHPEDMADNFRNCCLRFFRKGSRCPR